jgi:peroxiredoxin
MSVFNVGDIVPDLRVVDSGGRLKPLSEQMGEKGLLVFVLRGTWCAFCVNQINSVQRNYHRYANQGVETVFITPEPYESIETFKLSLARPLPFGLHADPTRQTVEYFVERGAVGVSPATYVLDRDRRIVWRYIGKHEEDRPGHNQITQVIADYLS